MFTTMCALLASGYEADVSATNWSPMRAQLRDRMQHQSGPAVEVMRNFYKQHELADPGQMLSRYIWFGLISGPAPKFEPILRRDELPPEVIALEGFRKFFRITTRNKKSASFGGRCSRFITTKSSRSMTRWRKSRS